ncbi:hypothetical protein D3C72_1417420 [compost metagenome]
MARQTLFKFLQAVGVQIHAIGIVTQFVAGLTDLDRRLFQHVQQPAEFLIHADQLNQQMFGGVKLAQHVVFFIVSQQLQGLLADGQQLAAVGQAFELRIYLFELTGHGRKLVQLFQLVLQQLLACVAFDGLLLMMGQFATALVPTLISLLHLR